MRRLVIALLVLVGLFVAVDYSSAALAESAVSRQMREQLGLVDDPAVRINGFPFLAQAVTGQYSSVDVTASKIRLGRMQEIDVSAQLRDVAAPLPMLLGSGPKSLNVQEVEGTVRVSAGDVERLVPGIEDLRIENINEDTLEEAVDDGGDKSLTSYDPDEMARLAGTAMMLGEKTEVRVIVSLGLVDGQVQIIPRDVQIGDEDADSLMSSSLMRTIEQRFTVRIDPGALPLAATPTKLRAENGALAISGIARDLTVGDGVVAAAG